VLQGRYARRAHLLLALVEDVKVIGRNEMSARSDVGAPNEQRPADEEYASIDASAALGGGRQPWLTIRCAGPQMLQMRNMSSGPDDKRQTVMGMSSVAFQPAPGSFMRRL
jgi:hypothetical protein